MKSLKKVSIFGVTGSIGQSTADLILSDFERFDVCVVSAARSVDKLAEMAISLKAEIAVIADHSLLPRLEELLVNHDIKAMGGEQGLLDAASVPVDITVAAIVGMAGLKPLMVSIENSKAVAIANKEPLVSAGALVLKAAKEAGCKILPVDSEHNAIFQVFDPENKQHIKQIVLTASGGPFREWSREKMSVATVEQAMAHPNWSMGAKISVDSASMMNKALEIIEAYYLFEIEADKINVIIHPQSVAHSMVEYADGSYLAQMGASDMRTPIAYALAWPDRMQTSGERLDITALSKLEFHAPDCERFPALSRAYEVLEKGSWACIALNAANEVAVEAFLKKKIGFLDIMKVIDFVLESCDAKEIDSLEAVILYDEACRDIASNYIQAGLKSKVG